MMYLLCKNYILYVLPYPYPLNIYCWAIDGCSCFMVREFLKIKPHCANPYNFFLPESVFTNMVCLPASTSYTRGTG